MAEVPSVENLVGILQSCRKRKDLSSAKLLHAHICKNGLEAHRVVSNHSVPMFVECGSLFDAQEVFNSLAYRNEHSWTSLILGYMQCGQSEHALNLYQKMQEDSVYPSSFTLVPLLKACAATKDMERGREIHADITQKGFERDLFVGSALVNLYAKCGSLQEAQEVLDKLSVRNVVSWNAVITGYVEHGSGEEAVKRYNQMQAEGVCPDPVTFVCILKACGLIEALEKCREIYIEITQKGFERHLWVGNTLVDMYAKCGSLLEAQDVFEKLSARDVVSWNSLMAGYVEHGPAQEALKCLEKMQLEGIYPSAVTFVWLLKGCCSLSAIDVGREMHAKIIKNELERNASVGSILVSLYAKCGSVSDAQEVLYSLPFRDVGSWTALIAGFAEHGPAEGGLKCFEQMQMEDVYPNTVTYVCTLKACGIVRAIGEGFKIHLQITHKGLERDHFVICTLVGMYAKCGLLPEAHNVLFKLPVQDAISWNGILLGYEEHGSASEVLKFFEQMQLEGVSPNSVTFVCALKACGNIAATDTCRGIHTMIIERGFEGYPLIGNSLIDMYCKYGALSEAWQVFDKLLAQEVVSWTALIAGYVDHGHGCKALKWFKQMQLEGISPNAVTFLSVLKACSCIRAIDEGRQIHMEITKRGCENDPRVGNSLIDMYAKCGSLLEAWEVFAKLSARELVIWTSLISGYSEHGYDREVLKCFEEMQLEGVSPNAATFVCLLKACGSMGAIDKGQEIHMLITRKRLELDLYLGGTLVVMYSKCDLLAEAQDMFDKLPFRDVVSWNAIIQEYVEHRLGHEALKCCEQMQFEGISLDAVTFVCILKACGTIAAIDKGREIQMEIIRTGIEGYPLVDNTMVDMYAKFGLLSEAQEVLEKLPVRDVVPWNACIIGYAEHGPGQEVLRCFEQMQQEGISPNAVTFVALLKACGRVGAINKGREVYTVMAQMGIEGDTFVGTTLISMYANCGALLEAWRVFDKLTVQDVVSWNALIAGCIINHQEYAALEYVEYMQECGVKPNAITFTYLLSACSHARLVFKGQEYFKMMKEEYDILPTEQHFACIASLLARSGHLFEAEKFVENAPCPSSEGMWRALLSSCKTYGEAELGLRCFQQLVRLNSKDASSYVLMADIYAGAGRWEDACMMEELRKHAGAKKKPASALIELNNDLQEFVVGSNQSIEISAILETLSSRMEQEGHVPYIDLIPISDGEKVHHVNM